MSQIKDIRNNLGLTQAEMADRLGITQSTLSRLETGVIVANKRTLMAAQALLGSRPAKASAAA